MDMTTLMLSVVFGSIGMGFFVYGKKQQHLPHLVAGLALMVFPYFITNAVAAWILGVVLTAAPFFVG